MAYCDRCAKYFGSESALEQHKGNSPRHWMCYDCNRDFPSHEARRQHWINSSRHNYCDRCDEDFDDYDDLIDHYEESHYYCRECNEVSRSQFVVCQGMHTDRWGSKLFDDQEDEDEHKDDNHWYCIPCKRLFKHEGALRGHQRSSIHQPKTISCPGRGCGKTFIERSHLLLHLESGTCSSGANRHLVDKHAVQMDRKNIITNRGKLIQYPDGSYSKPPTVEYWATEYSFNGRNYECALCHNEFSKLQHLNQHLQSPAHADKLYRCPPAGNGCNTQYPTLSALLQHIETSNCGIQRFRGRARDLVDDVTGKMRLLTF